MRSKIKSPDEPQHRVSQTVLPQDKKPKFMPKGMIENSTDKNKIIYTPGPRSPHANKPMTPEEWKEYIYEFNRKRGCYD